MVATLSGPANMHWKTLEDGVLISSPGFVTYGYDMRLVSLAAGKSYYGETELPVIVNTLRGKVCGVDRELSAKPRRNYDTFTYEQEVSLLAEQDSLLFLCYKQSQPTSSKKTNNTITGLEMRWTQPAPGCYRTDPKIEVDGIRINLWYLVPNKNGGIHNHAENQGHNIGGSAPFVEWHTQLRGNGWMVKYHLQDEGSEYERIEMNVGHAHPLFSTVKKGVVSYPWHAYVAGDKGALFVAFEDLRIK